jgi:hypothetical protein
MNIEIPKGQYCEGCQLLDSSGLCKSVDKMCTVEGKTGIPVDYKPYSDKYKIIKHKDCPNA